MVHQINLNEAKGRLPDLIDAALRGEEVFIFKDNQEAVRLVPVEPLKRQPQFGSAKGLVTVTDDFDMPLEDFNEYMS